MAIGQLFLWSAKRGEWSNCPREEITWLDRSLLSGGEDLTLHRAPRCAGVRYVHHRWELFSRDTSHRVYLAPDASGPDAPGSDAPGSDAPGSDAPGLDGPGPIPDAEIVRRTACDVLPVAPEHYESVPVAIEGGQWLVSVGAWVVRLRHQAPERSRVEPARGDSGAITREREFARRGGPAGPPGEDAVARVRSYFQRNSTARLAMAYYYEEFLLGRPAPQPVPMMNVVIALDLSGEGAVSDYKKLLQGIIWQERGHARDLAGFLLGNGLLTPADLDQARRVAEGNERAGICEQARLRLQYRPKES